MTIYQELYNAEEVIYKYVLFKNNSDFLPKPDDIKNNKIFDLFYTILIEYILKKIILEFFYNYIIIRFFVYIFVVIKYIFINIIFRSLCYKIYPIKMTIIYSFNNFNLDLKENDIGKHLIY